MAVVEELLIGLAWSVGGFVLGFILAALIFIPEVARLSGDNESVLKESRTDWAKRAGVVFLIGLAVVSTIFGYLSASEQRSSAERAERSAQQLVRISQCQSRFNELLVNLIYERSKTFSKDRDNMVILVRRALRDQNTPDALSDYLRSARRLSEQRPDIPVPPDCTKITRGDDNG